MCKRCGFFLDHLLELIWATVYARVATVKSQNALSDFCQMCKRNAACNLVGVAKFSAKLGPITVSKNDANKHNK